MTKELVETWILDFPFPPSVNSSLYPMRVKTKQGNQVLRLLKTKQHAAFLKETELWALHNKEALRGLAEELPETHLSVDFYFITHSTRIKRIDADNRIKPTLDALFKILEINDNRVYRVSSEKIPTNPQNPQKTIIKITKYTPQSEENLINHIKSL
jgi:Holliday junction resolvase RusA-like endonuclease